jgi:hypothetical protein
MWEFGGLGPVLVFYGVIIAIAAFIIGAGIAWLF